MAKVNVAAILDLFSAKLVSVSLDSSMVILIQISYFSQVQPIFPNLVSQPDQLQIDSTDPNILQRNVLSMDQYDDDDLMIRY